MLNFDEELGNVSPLQGVPDPLSADGAQPGAHHLAAVVCPLH